MTKIKINNPSARYYDENYEDYVRYSGEHFHRGLWHENTKTHEESLINTTKKAIEHLMIRQGDRVLDAGCGTGGSCRFIARHFDCEVYGITLSDELYNAAIQKNRQLEQKNLPRILIMDFVRTGFKKESFTKIYSIESMVHAESKESYIKEVYRILKKGGRIVIIDYFLLKKKISLNDKKIYKEWCKGWCLPSVLPYEKFYNVLKKEKFASIHFEDLSPLVQKSSFLIHQSAENMLPLVHIKTLSGEMPESRLHHTIANYRQKECFDNGIVLYGLFSAEKE